MEEAIPFVRNPMYWYLSGGLVVVMDTMNILTVMRMVLHLCLAPVTTTKVTLHFDIKNGRITIQQSPFEIGRGKRYKKGEECSVIVVYGDYCSLEQTTYFHVKNKNTATLEAIINNLL